MCTRIIKYEFFISFIITNHQTWLGRVSPRFAPASHKHIGRYNWNVSKRLLQAATPSCGEIFMLALLFLLVE